MKEISLILKGETATADFAKKIAKFAYVGDIFCLNGDLGAGKSTFARAFIQELAGEEIDVPSPTFTLMQPYETTRLPVAHVDAYRMSSPEELYELDLEEFFEGGVTLIEWPSKIESVLPNRELPEGFIMESEHPDKLDIFLEEQGEDARKITLKASGTWAHRLGLLDENASRPVTQEGRESFLNENNIEFKELIPLAQDCSHRSYHRLQTPDGSRLLMDAPPPMENVKPFIHTSQVFEKIGITTPKIYVKDEKNGYLLLEDFGKTSFTQGFADGKDRMAWLKAAVDVLIQLANSPLPEDVPAYSAKTPFAESCRYTDWYLPTVSGHATHPADRAEMARILEALYAPIMAAGQTLCHWDYHCDNLMICGETATIENVGVIDFQDARTGPLAFDLACLLEDRHETPLTKEEKQELIQHFLNGVKQDVDEEAFMTSYRLVLLHRIFKIFGLYMRLKAQRPERTEFPWNLEKLWKTVYECLEDPTCGELKTFVMRMEQQAKDMAKAV